MEKKNVPSGKKFRSTNFTEMFDASTRDNEKWQTRAKNVSKTAGR